MYRGAMRSILSELVRQERLLCIDQLNISAAKTKAAVEVLAELGLEEVLIITDSISEELHLATRNLARVAVMETHEIDPYSLVGFDRVLITRPALEEVEKWLEPKTGDTEREPEVNGHKATDAEAEDGGDDNVAES